jgi:hypothetical protein
MSPLVIAWGRGAFFGLTGTERHGKEDRRQEERDPSEQWPAGSSFHDATP